jgi:methylmalonyl-CoA mutase
MVGVSEFVDPTEEPPKPAVPDYRKIAKAAAMRLAARPLHSIEFAAGANRAEQVFRMAKANASIGQMMRAIMLSDHHARKEQLPSALSVHAFAEPFERLREQALAHQQSHGHPPCVLLVLLDAPENLRARIAFCEHLLEAGGFAAHQVQGISDQAAMQSAMDERHARAAMLIGADAQYPAMVPHAASLLHGLGARMVILAGNPGAYEPAFRQSGVDRFAYLKADAAALLEDIMSISCGTSAIPVTSEHVSSPSADFHTGHLS